MSQQERERTLVESVDIGISVTVLVLNLASLRGDLLHGANRKVISVIRSSDPKMTSYTSFQFILNHAVLAKAIPVLSKEYFTF